MADIASLGIRVDSTQAASAAKTLDTLAKSGKSAATAVGELAPPSRSAGAALGQVGAGLKTVERASEGAKSQVRGVSDAMREQKAEINALQGLLRRYAFQLGSAFSIGKILAAADEWGQLASRMQIATGSAEVGAAAMEKMLQVANRTYQPIGEVSELFIRTSESLKEIGYSSEQVLAMVEALSYGLTVSAAHGQRASSVIDAWSKSILRGKMDMEAFNTVISYAPRLQQAMAESLNTTNAGLMRMVMAGEMTAEKMMAVTKEIEQMGREADLMPVTMRDAFNRMGNSLAKWAGEMNEGVGVTRLLTESMNALSDNIGAVIIAIGTLVSIKVASWLGALALGTKVAAGGFAALAVAARSALASIGPLGWAMLAVGTAATAWELFSAKSRAAGRDAEDATRTAANAMATGVNRMTSDLDRLIQKYGEVASARDQALTTSSFMTESLDIYDEAIKRADKLRKALRANAAETFDDGIPKGTGGPHDSIVVDGKRTTVGKVREEIAALEALVGARDDVARKIQQRSLADLLADPKGMTEAEQRVAAIQKIRQMYDDAVLGETDPAKIAAAQRARDRMIAEAMKPRGGQRPDDSAARYLQSLERQRDMLKSLSLEEQALADIASGRIKVKTDAQRDAILATAREMDALRAQREIDEQMSRETIETMREEIRARDDLVKAAEQEAKQLALGNVSLAEEVEMIGKGALARMAIEKARISSAIAVKEEALALAQKNAADAREAEALREQIRLLRERQGLIDQKGVAEALAEDAKALEEVSKNAFENIQRTLGQGLYDMMDGNFKSIGRSFADMLKRMVAEATAADLMGSLFGDSMKGGSNKGILSGVVGGFLGMFGAKSHATGLDYVPYDNYPAILHKGERVMTAAENRGAGAMPVINQTLHVGAGVSRSEVAAALAISNAELKRQLYEDRRNGGVFA